MTIYRTDKTNGNDPYARISLDVINSDLSPLARLAMIYLLSKPDDWQLRDSDLRRYLECGWVKVKSVIAELKAAGYLVRKQNRDKDGKWYTSQAKIFESPDLKSTVVQNLSNGESTVVQELYDGETTEVQELYDGDLGVNEPWYQNRTTVNRTTVDRTTVNGSTVTVPSSNKGVVVTTDQLTTESTNKRESNALSPSFSESDLDSDSKPKPKTSDIESALAELTGANLNLLKGAKLKELQETAKAFEANGIGAEAMRDFGTWWFDTHLGWKKSEERTPPTLEQIGAHWDTFRSADTAPAEVYTPAGKRVNGKYRPRTWADTQRKKREAKGQTDPGDNLPAGENIVEKLSKPGAFRLKDKVEYLDPRDQRVMNQFHDSGAAAVGATLHVDGFCR